MLVAFKERYAGLLILKPQERPNIVVLHNMRVIKWRITVISAPQLSPPPTNGLI